MRDGDAPGVRAADSPGGSDVEDGPLATGRATVEQSTRLARTASCAHPPSTLSPREEHLPSETSSGHEEPGERPAAELSQAHLQERRSSTSSTAVASQAQGGKSGTSPGGKARDILHRCENVAAETGTTRAPPRGGGRRHATSRLGRRGSRKAGSPSQERNKTEAPRRVGRTTVRSDTARRGGAPRRRLCREEEKRSNKNNSRFNNLVV